MSPPIKLSSAQYNGLFLNALSWLLSGSRDLTRFKHKFFHEIRLGLQKCIFYHNRIEYFPNIFPKSTGVNNSSKRPEVEAAV